MHLRSLKKTRKDVSLHDPIGTDKEGDEITLEILDDREKEVVVRRFGLELGGEERNTYVHSKYISPIDNLFGICHCESVISKISSIL